MANTLFYVLCHTPVSVLVCQEKEMKYYFRCGRGIQNKRDTSLYTLVKLGTIYGREVNSVAQEINSEIHLTSRSVPCDIVVPGNMVPQYAKRSV